MSNTFSRAEQTTPVLERLPAIMVRTGLKRSSVYALVAAGYFPKPVKLSERSSAWIVKEVDRWIADRIAERDSSRQTYR
jgi:prophage regulatory protein